MEKARYNTELYSNLRVPLNNVKPSNFWGSHQIGVSPSRINDFITGRAEPSLKIAKRLCLCLGITASAMLGL